MDRRDRVPKCVSCPAEGYWRWTEDDGSETRICFQCAQARAHAEMRAKREQTETRSGYWFLLEEDS